MDRVRRVVRSAVLSGRRVKVIVGYRNRSQTGYHETQVRIELIPPSALDATYTMWNYFGYFKLIPVQSFGNLEIKPTEEKVGRQFLMAIHGLLLVPHRRDGY